jgi:hypothetical protein
MKTSIRVGMVSVLVACLFFVLGCAAPGVEGKWRGTVLSPDSGPIENVVEFRPNGTVTLSATYPEQVESGQPGVPGLVMELEGTYRVAGERLECDMTTATSGGERLALPQEFNKFKGSFKRDGNKLTWHIADSGQPVVFNREETSQ